METKHTPDLQTCPQCEGTGCANHPDSGDICSLCGGSGGVLADARVIAAAPEMLDALRSAKEELYQIAHSSCDPDSPDAMDSAACAYRECRDAIAKATGSP